MAVPSKETSSGEEGAPPRSSKHEPGFLVRLRGGLTSEHGWAKALTIALTIILGLGAVFVTPAVNEIQRRLDEGPTPDKIIATVDSLPDAKEFAGENHFLVPYGVQLPVPLYSAYCGNTQDDLTRLGPVVGAYVRINLQNVYDGKRPGQVQVTSIEAKVRDERPARSGVVVDCLNSGGDAPIVAYVRAEDGSTIRTPGPPPDTVKWRFSDAVVTGATTSFVLDPGEQQQINLTFRPSSQDRDVDLVLHMIANGKKSTITLTRKPITVPSDAKASPYVVTVKGVFNGLGHYDCKDPRNLGRDPSICTSDRVFTQAEEKAAQPLAKTGG